MTINTRNMENKKTAVDWLTEQIEQHILVHKNLPFNVLSKLKKQAKQMEKEQIIKAFNEGTFSEMEKIDAEEYYSESYHGE